MQLPLITPALTQRIEHVWAKERATRATGAMNRPGNPLGQAVQRFGAATAVRAAGAPTSVWMNRAVNVTGDTLDYVDDLLAFYREVGAQGYLELSPATATPELMQALAERGAYQSDFHAVTYGVPTADVPALPEGVAVREIEAHEIDLFLEMNFVGFGYRFTPEMAPGMRFWYDLPEWKLYLATVDGRAAGTAIMCLYDGVGYMASASTLPEARGRGVQKALLYRRIADATRAGCDLITGQCTFGSISYVNQERCGLRLAYNKAIWTTGRPV